MIYSYTLLGHSLMALLCALSALYLYSRVHTSKTIKAFFDWFLLYFFYNIFLVVPLLIFSTLNLFTFYFYVLALLFMGLAAFRAFSVALELRHVGDTKEYVYSQVYLWAMIAVVILHMIFPTTPVGSADGKWVFWYGNELISMLFSVLMFVAGWIFSWVFLSSLKKVSNKLIQFRSVLFGLAAFILPFAAYYYYGASSVFHMYMAFAAAIFGLALFLLGNLMGHISRASVKG